MSADGCVNGAQTHRSLGRIPYGKRDSAPALEHPKCLAQRGVGIGQVTHAVGVDDGVERVRLERQRFRVGLLESDERMQLARHPNLRRREIDTDRIRSTLSRRRSDKAWSRGDVQYARS